MPFRLNRHTITHIPLADRPKRLFTCMICRRRFETRLELNDHKQNIHNQKTKRVRIQANCEFCDKPYTDRTSFKNHLMIVHKLSEPDARTSCGMRARAGQRKKRKDTRIRVRPRATKPKPRVTCSICFRIYSRREFVASHLMGVHGKTEEEAMKMSGFERRTKRGVPIIPKKPRHYSEDSATARKYQYLSSQLKLSKP